MKREKCGTYAGWNVHQRHREPVCAECREAQRVYMSQRRATNEKAREYDRAHNAARSRAYARLAAEHPHRMRQLMREELRRDQLPKQRGAA